MSSNKLQLLAFLYFLQGVPYGFQSMYLPIFLRENQVTLTNISFFKLLLIPWLLKFCWAPLIDCYGTRKQWLQFGISGLAVISFVAVFIDHLNLLQLGMTMFLMNIFASTMDIALDSVAISTLRASDLPKGNMIQVVGYKLGSVVGGGILAVFMKHFQWRAIFLAITMVYIYAFSFVYVSPVLHRLTKYDLRRRKKVKFNSILNLVFIPKNESLKKNSVDDEDDTDSSSASTSTTSTGSRNSSDSADKDLGLKMGKKIPPRLKASDDTLATISLNELLMQLISLPGMPWFLVYVLIYKLGEQGTVSMLPLFLVDNKYSADEVRFWSATVGQSVSIFGSILGGMLINRFKVPLYWIMCQLMWIRIVPMGVALWVVLLWNKQLITNSTLYGFAVFSLDATLFFSGFITTVTFTAMMQCTRMAPVSNQATHYSALASAEVFGKLMFSSVCGALVDNLGYLLAFVVFIVLAALVLPMFYFFPLQVKVYMEDLIINCDREKEDDGEEDDDEEDNLSLSDAVDEEDNLSLSNAVRSDDEAPSTYPNQLTLNAGHTPKHLAPGILKSVKKEAKKPTTKVATPTVPKAAKKRKKN